MYRKRDGAERVGAEKIYKKTKKKTECGRERKKEWKKNAPYNKYANFTPIFAHKNEHKIHIARKLIDKEKNGWKVLFVKENKNKKQKQNRSFEKKLQQKLNLTFYFHLNVSSFWLIIQGH